MNKYGGITMKNTKVAARKLTGILDKVALLARESAKVKPYLEMTDEELVSAVQAGDSDAYKHVIDRYQGKIYAYIMRLTNHREEATDIAQDVFLKAYKHLHRFDTSRKFSSWIYRIAHNESVNWLKKKTRAKIESIDVHAEIGVQYASAEDIHGDLVRSQDKALMKNAIAALPEKYRVVMEMRYLKEYSYDEIGKALDKPVNTIGTLINRAKKKLADNMTISP